MLCSVSVPAHFESLGFVNISVCVQTYQCSCGCRLIPKCSGLLIVTAAPFAFHLIEIKAVFPEALCLFFVVVLFCFWP